MTKPMAKRLISETIKRAVILDKTDKLKMEEIKNMMNEYKLTRTQIKATIRCGNSAFLIKDDEDGTKREELLNKICSFIDENFDKPTKHKGLR